MGRLRSLAGIFTTAGVVAAAGVMTAPAAGARTQRAPRNIRRRGRPPQQPAPGSRPHLGGGLYLAEAGSGGDVCVGGGPEGETCVGLTGFV